MNTEDDTFEGIESRIAVGTNFGVRRVPTSTAKLVFPSSTSSVILTFQVLFCFKNAMRVVLLGDGIFKDCLLCFFCVVCF